jgi:hypothetical protein
MPDADPRSGSPTDSRSTLLFYDRSLAGSEDEVGVE